MTKFEILQKYRAQEESTGVYVKLMDSWASMGKNFIHIYDGVNTARSTRYYSKDMLYVLHIASGAGMLNGSLIFCNESFTDKDLALKWEDCEVLDYEHGYISFGQTVWSPNFRILLLPDDVMTTAGALDEVYSEDPNASAISSYQVQNPSFIPFYEEDSDPEQVQIQDSDYEEIMSCLGATFITPEELEYTRAQICNLAIKPALREFFKWCPAKTLEPTVVNVSRTVQEIDMPAEAYGVAGLSLQQNGMNAMGDTTNPFAYAWEQSFYGGGGAGINVGIGLMNTSVKGVANNGILTSIQGRAVNQAIINYARRVHYEGPYDRANGTKYIKLYSNTSGSFNIWWAKKSMNFDDVRYTQKENAIDLCKAKVMQLFGSLRRQTKADIPGMVDWSYLVTEGKELWDNTVKNLKEIVKGEGILRGSL